MFLGGDLKVGKTTTTYESLAKDFISELLEYNFQQEKECNPDIKMLQKRIVELSCKVHKIISNLEKEDKKLIEKYLDEKQVLAGKYYHISYIHGFGDCIRLLKRVKIM